MQRSHLIFFVLATVFLPAICGYAQATESSAEDLLRTAVKHAAANRKKAYAYTYIESWHNQNFNRRDKLTRDETAKYESIFIEDLPYLRKLEENGKPLSGDAAKEEQAKYETAVAARKGMTLDQKQAELKIQTLDFPLRLNLLPDFYAARIVGTETVGERPAIHIDCAPRTDLAPTTEEERKALSVHPQVWIDAKDQLFARVDGELIAPVNSMLPGATASITWIPVTGVWLPSQTTIRATTQEGRFISGFRTDVTYSDYRRFQVDVRVMSDPKLLAPKEQ